MTSAEPAEITPVSPAELARLIASAAVQLLVAGRSARVGVDGPIEDESGHLADAIAAELAERAVPVARVRAGDFLRARALRWEFGRDDPESFARLWYDMPAIRREVLDPLGPGGSGRWLRRLRDPDTDRAIRLPASIAADGTALVLDGRFLLRDDVRDALDVTVFLQTSRQALERRLPQDERRRVLPAWERYLAESDPAGRATVVVRYDHPDRPAVQPSG